MKVKPGDILYRKYSDKNDLYCVIKIKSHPILPRIDEAFVTLLPYYTAPAHRLSIQAESSLEEWFIQADLNNYEIKDKFLKKIKGHLDKYLGLVDDSAFIDNLTYIEILAELRQYEDKENTETDK